MDETKMDFTASIDAALNGSMDAFNFLYRTSLPSFKKTVMEYTSNTNDIDDILQEAYIKIFSQLKTLKNANSFLAWGCQICTREAINFGKKKQAKKNDVVLMPETTDEDEGMGMDEVPADTYSTEFNPEARIDSAETKRLMDEMLGELTENQRLVICMWEDQYTFKQIAEELNMPENTVKSHFNRGKKALETKVKDLEKKGTKLYGMAPFPFFLWIFSQFRQSYTPDVSSEYVGSLLNKVVEQLPENMINVGRSTPNSIQKYGTEEMKQSLPQTGEANASSVNVDDGQTHSSDTGNTSESVADNGASSGDAGAASDGSTQGTASASKNGSANISADASGHNAAKTAAKTAGKISAARIIVPVLAVVIIGTAGIIAFRSLNNDQDTGSNEVGEEALSEDPDSISEAEAAEKADVYSDDEEQEEAVDWDDINDNNYGITLDMVSGTELVPRGSYLWDAPASLIGCNEGEDLWLYACVAPGTEDHPENEGEHLTVLRRGNQIFVSSTTNAFVRPIPILGDYIYDYPSIYLTNLDNDDPGYNEVLILAHDKQFGAYASTDREKTEYGELISESEEDGALYYETANLIVIAGDFNDEVVNEWYEQEPFSYSSDILNYGLVRDLTDEEVEEERQEKLFTFSIGDNTYTVQYNVSCDPISHARHIRWSRDLGAQYGNYDFDYDGGALTLKAPFALTEEFSVVYVGECACDLKLYRNNDEGLFNLMFDLENISITQIGP